jgi:hypothetical protein
MDGSGPHDALDSAWRPSLVVTYEAPSLIGEYNDYSIVDAVDYVDWRKTNAPRWLCVLDARDCASRRFWDTC